jgi:CDP-paratose synthetase
VSAFNHPSRATPNGRAVLLTGGTGFIGQHMASSLLRAGFTVLGLHRRARPETLGQDAQLHWITEQQAAAAIEKQRPEAILHLATDYGLRNSLSAMVESNVRLPLHLLELGAANGCAMFINTDSYFAKKTFDYPHMRPYIQSKNELMRWAALACASTPGMKVVSARLEHVYGPGDGEQKFIPHLLKQLLCNQTLALTPGEQLRDFVHVDDVVNAYLAILQSAPQMAPGITELEVGCGVATSVRRFVETAQRVTGSQSLLQFGALPYREREIMCSTADPAPLQALGWRACHDLVSGLKATVASMRGNIDAGTTGSAAVS